LALPMGRRISRLIEGRQTMKTLSKLRLIAFGSASILTRGADTGVIPENDLSVYKIGD